MTAIIEAIYGFLWNDLFTITLGQTKIGIPFLVLLLIPTGVYFTVRTRFMPIRKLPDMIRALGEKLALLPLFRLAEQALCFGCG